MAEREGSRLYRGLLCLLPARFRERHGAAMEQAFCSLRSASRARGWRALAGVYVMESWDVVRTAVVLRVRTRRTAESVEASGVGGRGRVRTALGDEFRLTVRSATRHRAFFAFAALTFALGVGATTATFSVLKSVVLEPLPFPDAERMVIPWRTIGESMFSPDRSQVEALLSERSVFEDAATFGWFGVVISDAEASTPLESVTMGPHLAGFLGIHPFLGRFFSEKEFAGDGAHVVVLSHALWRGQYGGDRGVLGREVTLNGEPWTVVGVMSPGVVRPNGVPTPVDVWLPLPANAPYAEMVARLRPGVTIEQASRTVDEVVKRTSKSETYGGRVTRATAMREGGLHDPLRVLMVAVTLLLLITCVNVSNLLVTRASARRRETALLAALGAGRARLVRQFLLESLLLALAGGVAGVAIAWVLVRGLVALRPAELPMLVGVRLDGGVLLFALAICTGAGLAFGLAPALRAARANAGATLARGSRSEDEQSGRVRWLLVGSEIALSFALLVGASLVIRTLHEYATRDPGYRPEGLIDVSVRLPRWRYGEEPARRLAYDRIVERVTRIPDIEAVSLAGGVPPRAGIYFGQARVEGGAADPKPSRFHGMSVDGNYLRVIGEPLVAGRTFNAAELAGDVPAVLLGETAARQLFPDGNALGGRFGFSNETMNTVVGIVRDAALLGPSAGTDIPIAYWPQTEVAADTHVLVRTGGGEAAGLASSLRQAVRAVEPLAIVDVARGSDLLGLTLARERFTTALLAGFAGLALLLAAIGLYSVLSEVVSRRTHEIGVRVSLGADAASIRRLVLRSGMVAIACGLGAGGLLAGAGIRLLGTHVFGLSARQPLAWAVAAAVLATISLVALYRPVQRAARVDPMRAIRAD